MVCFCALGTDKEVKMGLLWDLAVAIKDTVAEKLGKVTASSSSDSSDHGGATSSSPSYEDRQAENASYNDCQGYNLTEHDE